MAKRSIKRSARTSDPSNAGGRKRAWLISGVVVIIVISLGALLYLSVRGPSPIRGLISFARPSRGHDNSLAFESGELPPVGGTHHDAWQNCGIYDEPIGTGNAVHSMEHGAVWITYQPDLPEEDVAYLEELVRGEQFLLLSPYPDLKSPVVLTAWGLQLEVESPEDGRVEEFVDRYQVGPQTPERGATCQNGVGEPIP